MPQDEAKNTCNMQRTEVHLRAYIEGACYGLQLEIYIIFIVLFGCYSGDF